MITHEKAQSILKKNTRVLPAVYKDLTEALGCITARNIYSPIPLPVFDNSAMDGYVFRSEDTRRASAERPVHLKISGVIKAGDAPRPLKNNQAFAIMTGAVIPRTADTVIAQEKAAVAGSALIFTEAYPSGRHVRRAGEELKKNSLLLKKGIVMRAAAAGILASVGKKSVPVHRKPVVHLIATGSELTGGGKKLRPGKIYDSNSPMVRSALIEMGLEPALVRHLKDDPMKIEATLSSSLASADVLILMGGVSAGQTDHVRPLLKKLGTRTLFWKVRQKPGKPLYFGRKGCCLVLGLPGNPASVYTCFYEYAYPALRRLMGHENPFLRSEILPLAGPVQADGHRTLFLKAQVRTRQGRRRIVALGNQASHMLSSLGAADGIAVLAPAGRRKNGRTALMRYLPGLEGSL